MPIAQMSHAAPGRFSQAFEWAGYLLGFAMGGFFDGILLHQVLQWHHLLSGVQRSGLQDLRVQILADGLFHAAMYAIALVGLWMLCRARGELADANANRWLLANALIGFGAWHVVDAVLSHWILQIHRIRMDTEIPLAWDLVWMVVFGVAALLAGWALRRRIGGGNRPGDRRPVTAAVLALLIPLSGTLAALPPPGVTAVTVLFGPQTTSREAFAAVAAVDGRVVWSDGSGQVWVVDTPESATRWELYRHGALLVSGSLLPAGCFSWSRPA
jgi:uncharacterized membrane protein